MVLAVQLELATHPLIESILASPVHCASQVECSTRKACATYRKARREIDEK
jgi:hypothetical protein